MYVYYTYVFRMNIERIYNYIMSFKSSTYNTYIQTVMICFQVQSIIYFVLELFLLANVSRILAFWIYVCFRYFIVKLLETKTTVLSFLVFLIKKTNCNNFIYFQVWTSSYVQTHTTIITYHIASIINSS